MIPRWHSLTISVVCLALGFLCLSAIDCEAQEALTLPSKPVTVNRASDWVWTRPVETHTKLAIGAVVATVVIDAVATGLVLRRIGRVERDYSVSLVDKKELIGSKAFGNVLTVAQLIATARRAPKATTTTAYLTTGLNLWSVQQNVQAWQQLGRVK